MKLRSILRGSILRAAIPAGLIGTGAAVFMLAGSGAAMAQNGTCSGSCVTTASVTVGSQLTISDNTPSITFLAPASLPGLATNTPTVSLLVSSNDPAGYTVTVTGGQYFTGQASSSNKFSVNNLNAEGNNTAGSFYTFGASGVFPGPIDVGSGVTTGSGATLTDTYQLNVPNTPADTYSDTLTYSLAGN